MREPKTWISILILVVLGLHAVPVISYQGERQNRWPFLAWAMYAKSIPPGPIEAMRRQIVGVTSRGEVDTVTANTLGISRFAWGARFIRPLFVGDTAAAQELMRRLNHDRRDPLVELQLHTEVHRVSDSGLVMIKLPVIAYPADSGNPP